MNKGNNIEISIYKLFFMIFGILSLIFPWFQADLCVSDQGVLSFQIFFSGNIYWKGLASLGIFSTYNLSLLVIIGTIYVISLGASMINFSVERKEKNKIISIMGLGGLIASVTLWISFVFVLVGFEFERLICGFYILPGYIFALFAIIFKFREVFFKDKRYYIIVSSRKRSRTIEE